MSVYSLTHGILELIYLHYALFIYIYYTYISLHLQIITNERVSIFTYTWDFGANIFHYTFFTFAEKKVNKCFTIVDHYLAWCGYSSASYIW